MPVVKWQPVLKGSMDYTCFAWVSGYAAGSAFPGHENSGEDKKMIIALPRDNHTGLYTQAKKSIL